MNFYKRHILVYSDSNAGDHFSERFKAIGMDGAKFSLHGIKTGISLLTGDLSNCNAPDCRIQFFSPCMVFAYIFLAGTVRPGQAAPLQGNGRKSKDGTNFHTNGQCTSYAGKNLGLSFFRIKQHSTRMLLLLICPRVFLNFFKGERQTPACLLPLTPAGVSREFSISRRLDAATWVALRQLICTPPGADFGKSLLRRKIVLQLLTGEIQSLRYPAPKKNDVHLSLIDRSNLSRARDILIKTIESPPDIKTLSRQIGMNEYKFKKGFKALFGKPPMTFLRHYRMEQARNLLLTKKASVTEAALTVGFSNPSSFSACYAKYWGHKPSQITQIISGQDSRKRPAPEMVG